MSEKVILRPSTYDRLADSMAQADALPPHKPQQPTRRLPTPTPENWIKVTSATPSTATLPGGTISAYSAVWSYFDTGASPPAWVDTANTAWWYGANGETPTSGTRYRCACVGMDTSGVPIWAAARFGSLYADNSNGATDWSLTAPYALQTPGPISLTVSGAGTYLITASVNGHLFGAMQSTHKASLEVACYNTTDSVYLGGGFYTIATLSNPTAANWPNNGYAWGSITITGQLVVSTTPKTIQIQALVFGNTADVAGANVGNNADGNGYTIIQAFQIG